MTATVSFTESDVRAALRLLLLGLVPAGVEVVKAQDNRVATPSATTFVTINANGRTRLSTNVVSYFDPAVSGGTGTGERRLLAPTQLDFDLDVYGPLSDTVAQLVTTTLRDAYACDFFRARGLDAAPLYTSEPMQLPFIDESKQYEDHWHVTVTLQANFVVAVPQDFADEFVVQLQAPLDGASDPVVDVAPLVPGATPSLNPIA